MPGRIKRSERSLGDLDDLVESGGINDGDVGEHLTVENDVRLLETVDELAVGRALGAAGGVDTHRPEAAVLTLFLLASFVGVDVGIVNGIVRCADALGAGTVETFCTFQDASAQVTLMMISPVFQAQP